MMEYIRTHSLTIDGINTWERWGLIMTEESTPPPEQITSFVEVPGKIDRYLDTTHDVTDAIQFNRRECSWTFAFNVTDAFTYKRILREITSEFTGRKLIYPSYEEGWHYVGYVSVKEESLNGHSATITISANCNPYLLKNEVTELHYNVYNSVSVTFDSGIMPTPINVAGNASFTVEDADNDAEVTITASEGDSFTDLDKRIWRFDVTGTGYIVFSFQEGRL